MHGDATVVTVVGSFDIMQIQEVCTRLHEALTSHREVVFDLSAIDGIDLAGLQLVCAAHRTAMEYGVCFSIVRPSTPVPGECARSAGFSSPVPCQGAGGSPCIWDETGDDFVGGRP